MQRNEVGDSEIQEQEGDEKLFAKKLFIPGILLLCLSFSMGVGDFTYNV